jgi:large conductance mechanosensitive channel
MQKGLKRHSNNTREFIKDFRSFALKEKISDFTVGVVVGSAFGAIITSLVANILMPVISMLLGIKSFEDLRFVIEPETAETAEVAIRYGLFLESFVNFILIAFFVFLAVRIIIKARKKYRSKASHKTTKPTKEQKLLSEIVTLLKQQKTQ